MHKARLVFYVSAALMCLSISVLVGVHFGSHTAQATIVTEPVGVILAVSGNRVLTTTGEIWYWFHHTDFQLWTKLCDLPIPLADVHAFESNELDLYLLAKNGDYWQFWFGSWYNCGQPPVSPVPTSQQSWGGVKDKYNPEGKP